MTGSAALKAHQDLLAAVRSYVTASADVGAFVGDELHDPLEFNLLEPASLPAVSALPALAGIACVQTQRLTDALLEAAPYLQWRQSYAEDQVGAPFLANYAWANIVSPEGPYISEDVRVCFGYWGAGLDYPDHTHEPSEIYVTLAGCAKFRSASQGARHCAPGALWKNESGVRHGALIEPGPLLAMAVWRGAQLTARSELTAENRQ